MSLSSSNVPLLGTTHRGPECRCLKCEYVIDAHAGIGLDEKPRAGDFTICMRCGHVMAFTADGTVRALTRKEERTAAADPEIRLAQRAVFRLKQ